MYASFYCDYYIEVSVMLISYNVVAMKARIVYNKSGDHDPDGMLYVLKENVSKLKKQIKDNPNTPSDMVEPLVLRANVGDTVIINFENRLKFPASIHIKGVRYEVFSSDGTMAGYNKSSVVLSGQKAVYRWYPEKEGIYLFNDLGNPLSGETGSNIHGLFGALIVEEPGATWTHTETGDAIKSGVYADIHHPAKEDFREYVLLFHDEIPAKNIHGENPVDPHTGLQSHTHGINYRSEPLRNRTKAHHHHEKIMNLDVKDCAEHHIQDIEPEEPTYGENDMHSSWVWGDPATPVLRAYRGDPAKIRLAHMAIQETHVFHLHLYQWRLNPEDANSTLIDSISIGPQESYTIVPLHGAGSLQKAMGDAIFHCHLYPHFHDGMWGLWRTHDVLEDGSRFYPDGSRIKALKPLPDREPPPIPTPDKPGYPLFIPGTFGKRSPRPPFIVENGREPTELEMKNFAPNAVPGAVFVNPTPPDAPVKRYNIAAIQTNIVYNSGGWHDPEGRLYVLAEDEEDVLSGAKKPEPLVIRANAGDCIEIHLTNKLPKTLGPNAFEMLTETTECTPHVHLVKFDALSSDGGNNGWNYNTGIRYGETGIFRWYADRELHTCFFHDHIFANSHQQHGLFAALIVEPQGSTYVHPKTGEMIKSGTQAVIKNSSRPDFREFALFVHDFAYLYDSEGNPLNPPKVPGSHDDPGVMGINYTSEPFHLRQGDPAYVFSSYVHGDPCTPLLECYNGDPVKIRLIDGSHEEQHVFNLHNYKWRKEIDNPKSQLVCSQTLGVSEAFNFEFAADSCGDQDCLYYFGGLDDLWLGLWGILRVYDSCVEGLVALADRTPPKQRTMPLPTKTGELPPKAAHPGNPCRKDSLKRYYEVVAIQRDIVYNRYGDHDPDGLMFVLAEDEKEVLCGRKKVEPLIIRANVGDCIDVKLINHLPESIPETLYPEVPVQQQWPASNRVSLHAQMLKYDGRGSDGAAVGFNPNQTIGPGESITYRWYADEEYGILVLSSYGDIRNHRHRGLFGAIIIEPYGSSYFSPFTGSSLKSGSQAIIKTLGKEDYREFVVLAQNGINMLDKSGNRIKEVTNWRSALGRKKSGEGDITGSIEEVDDLLYDMGLTISHTAIDQEMIEEIEEIIEDLNGAKEQEIPHEAGELEEVDEGLDYEDQGLKGFNYRSERFENRLRRNRNRYLVFSSRVHGDPATPVFYAYASDPVTFRYAMVGDKPRNTTFGVHGHSWLQQTDNPYSNNVSLQGALSVGNTANIKLTGGASKSTNPCADYIYGSEVIGWDLEQGMWGLMRVLRNRIDGLKQLKNCK